MEEWFLSLCFTAASTLIALLFLWLSGGKRKPAVKRQLPPGPWTLPVIGSLHHVVSILPHRKIKDMSRRHGPLMHLTLGEVPTVIVSSAEAAALVMKTNGLTFAGRPCSATVDIFGCGGKGIFFAPYSDHCRQMRKLCNVELLSTKQVKQTEGIRAEEVGNLLRSIAASNGAIVNVSKMVATLSNNVVTRAVFGGRFTKQDEYLRDLDEALVLVGGFCLVDLFPSSLLVRWLSNGERRMRRCQGRMQHFISSIIDERKAARTAGGGACSTHHENLLDVLLRLQQENALEYPLTTESIGAVLFDLFAGGTETTGNVLAWAMSELMHSPNTMAKAQHEVRDVLGEGRDLITTRDLSELHYMRKIIKEVLRLHPPGPLIPRMATEDCTIMGYDIPKGTVVHINVLAISQDARHWNNPEEFRPERFDNNNINYNGTYFEFIPFGAGRRQCPGIQFGASVTEMALTNLLYHFDWMLPDGVSPASLDMSEKFSIAVSRRHDLELRATPHTWFNNVMLSK